MSAAVPIFGSPVDGLPCRTRPSAYALMRNESGQIAVVLGKTSLHLPGGGVEDGETREQAAIRECVEETGLVISIRGVLGEAVQIVHAADEHCCYEKQSVFYLAEVTGTAPVTPGHQLFWLDPAEAAQRLKHESHRWAVRLLG